MRIISGFFLLASLGAHASDVAAPKYTEINETIFKAACVNCHSGEKPKGKVDVSAYDKLIASDVIVAGKPDDSPLYLEVKNEMMPPGEMPKLTPDQLKALYDWIAGGALND